MCNVREVVTAEEVNALPDKFRLYIHDLETRCDPAGDVRTITILRDLIAQLQAKICELTDIVTRYETFLNRKWARVTLPPPLPIVSPDFKFVPKTLVGASESQKWMSGQIEKRIAETLHPQTMRISKDDLVKDRLFGDAPDSTDDMTGVGLGRSEEGIVDKDSLADDEFKLRGFVSPDDESFRTFNPDMLNLPITKLPLFEEVPGCLKSFRRSCSESMMISTAAGTAPAAEQPMKSSQ